MFGLTRDPHRLMHLVVLDSDEVRAAKGYREARERTHAHRERSLVEILRRGRRDGSFPLADPDHDAMAISALVSREMSIQGSADGCELQRAGGRVLHFALRALGAVGPTTDRR
jgi:hypothetical protein